MSTAAIARSLHELLGSVGFERHRQTWNRRSGTFVDVVDIQVSKAGDSVTMNAGVIDPELYTRCWGRDPSVPVDEPSCTVRARVGELKGSTDVWWPIDAAGTPSAVVGAAAKDVLPFLERMHSREALMEFLSAADVLRRKYPPPIIYLALLKHDLGDDRGACELLEALGNRVVGPWRAKVAAVSAGIGCNAD